MRSAKTALGIVLALLLAAAIIASYLTRDESAMKMAIAKPAPKGLYVIDDRLLNTARRLELTADSPEEQAISQEAVRLADHDLDQAYEEALRQTSVPVVLKGSLKAIADHITALKQEIGARQAQISKLTKQAATDEDAAGQLELAQAQLTLEQDELADAREDLARQGGDPQVQIRNSLKQHEAMEHKAAARQRSAGAAAWDTLIRQLQGWWQLREREQELEAAFQQASNKAASLGREHEALEEIMHKKPVRVSPSAGDPEEEDTATMMGRLKQLSGQTKTLMAMDKRMQDDHQLADVYKSWIALVHTRQRSVTHALLASVAWILAILFVGMLLDRAIRQAFARQTDRKRLHQLRTMATIAIQLVGALLILLVTFGPPNQISTIIGLATAGLTVVLKDFIVAFFGWFALMGKNGIRIGDFVEIEGVGGEVIEIGVLKTVLLEMGNWTNTGHPTGRHVAFVNKYAIEGHYFNFSTAGQWLWDELSVNLPSADNAYQTAMQIRETVERATSADAQQAEQDWERVTHQYGTRSFSARPAVDLRPSLNGIDVKVQYITRAPERYEVKSRLFAAIVDLLHKPAA